MTPQRGHAGEARLTTRTTQCSTSRNQDRNQDRSDRTGNCVILIFFDTPASAETAEAGVSKKIKIAVSCTIAAAA